MCVSKRVSYAGPSRAGEMLLELLGRYTCEDERLARRLLHDADPNAGVEFPLSAQIRAPRRIVYRDLLCRILFAAFFGAVPVAGARPVPFRSSDGKSSGTRSGSERPLRRPGAGHVRHAVAPHPVGRNADGKRGRPSVRRKRRTAVVILRGESRHFQRIVVYGAGHRTHERVLRSRPAPLHPRRQSSPAGEE